MISFAEQLQEIKCMARWWDVPESQAKAAAIHGAKIGSSPVNDHGVFANAEEVRLNGKKSGSCNAEIHLAQTPMGHWLVSVSYTIGWHGSGSMPSIWDQIGFHSREEALSAAIASLMKTCDKHMTPEECHGGNPNAGKYARELKQLLAELENSRVQLSLFEQLIEDQ